MRAQRPDALPRGRGARWDPPEVRPSARALQGAGSVWNASPFRALHTVRRNLLP